MFDPADLAEIQGRLRRLTPEAKPRWGSFTVDRVLCHMIDFLTVPLEGAVEPILEKGPPMFIRHLARLYLPFPKGIPTMNEMLATDPEVFADDLERVLQLAERFAAARDGEWVYHPFFGPLDGTAWGKLTWRHLDHHLKQFGV